MTYESLLNQASSVAAKYDQLNKKQRGRTWSATDLMSGFVGDVGDLSKIIMAKEGLREIENVDAKLAHELADCLWSVLVLAAKYQIDLPREFSTTMQELDEKITAQLAS